jgi:hypothetical protein
MENNKIETAGIDEIVENIKKMPVMVKVMMYRQAQAWREHRSELNKVADLFNKQYYRVVEVYKIKNDMYVVEYEDKHSKEKYFKPVEKLYFRSETYFDFDSALLAALSLEKTGRTEAGYWAGKLMGIGEGAG